MKSDEAKAAAILAISAALIIGIVLTGSKILEALGLKDTKEDKQTSKAVETAQSIGLFNEAFLKNKPLGALILSNAAADAAAKLVYDSVGFFVDSPDKLSAAFDGCRTQSQAAYIAYRFKLRYKKSMFTYISNAMDTTEQKAVLLNVLTRLNNLPKYTI